MKLASNLFVLIFILSSTSCMKNSNIEFLKNENLILTNKVDSLNNLINQYSVVTMLNNNSFSAKVGEKYSVESMAVLKNGLKLDSLRINGRLIKEYDLDIEVNNGFFGPVIQFTPISVGTYKIEANVSSFAWENRSIKTEWEIYVNE